MDALGCEIFQGGGQKLLELHAPVMVFKERVWPKVGSLHGHKSFMASLLDKALLGLELREFVWTASVRCESKQAARFRQA